MRSLFALDVLLAGYAGLMVGPIILMTRWLGTTFGGFDGLVLLYLSNHYGVLLLGIICTAWCVAHWVLPFPSLVLAIGLRMNRPWSNGLGRVIGVLLLMLPPIGSLIGALLMFKLSMQRGEPTLVEQS